MLGGRLDRSGQAEELFEPDARRGRGVGDLRPALGQGARLVEDDRVDLVEGLQALPALDEDAPLGPLARPDHDGRRRGQAHGAGTGDDEDGHEVEQGRDETGLGPEQGPGREGQDGDADDGRHEDPGDDVGQALDGGLGALGLLDQPDDAGQRGVLADAFGPEPEAAPLIEGGPDDGRAGRLVHGQALAADHGLVDRRPAFDDDAVDRDGLAGPDDEDVAGPDVLDGHLALPVGADDAGRPRPQAHEPPHGVGRPALGPGLEQAAEQDEHDDDGRGVEVDLGLDARQREQARPDGRGDAEEVGGRSAHGHEGVHVGRAVLERAPGPFVEAQAEDELDGRSQGPEDEEVLQRGRHPGEPVPHAAEEDDQGQRSAPEDVAAEREVLRVAGLFDLGGLVGHVVSGSPDRCDEGLAPGEGRVDDDGGLGRRDVDGGLADAGDLAQGPFDVGRAARAAHPRQGQLDADAGLGIGCTCHDGLPARSRAQCGQQAPFLSFFFVDSPNGT